MECKGIAACPHKFLKADGFDKCTSCHGMVCMHCRGCLEDNIYYLSCYAAELLAPSDTAEGGLQIQSMRHELGAKWGVERAGDMTIEEVEDLFELRTITTSRLNDLAGSVPFPIHSTNELNSHTTEEWQPITEINFGEGGAFISDPALDARFLPGILDLFASLVRFDTNTKTDWEHDPKIYDSLPTIFIDFAKNCRIDDGYRLLKRCIRHSFDSQCQLMDTSMGTLVIDQD